jgi:hypothetical protein
LPCHSDLDTTTFCEKTDAETNAEKVDSRVHAVAVALLAASMTLAATYAGFPQASAAEAPEHKDELHIPCGARNRSDRHQRVHYWGIRKLMAGRFQKR